MTIDEMMKQLSRMLDAKFDERFARMRAQMLADGADPDQVDEVITGLIVESKPQREHELRVMRRRLESET